MPAKSRDGDDGSANIDHRNGVNQENRGFKLEGAVRFAKLPAPFVRVVSSGEDSVQMFFLKLDAFVR